MTRVQLYIAGVASVLVWYLINKVNDNDLNVLDSPLFLTLYTVKHH